MALKKATLRTGWPFGREMNSLFSVIEDRNGKTGEFWAGGNGVYERAAYSSSKAAL